MWKDEWIYLKDGQRLTIPEDNNLRFTILQEAHNSQISGHLRNDKTYEQVLRNFYWLKLSQDVKRYVKKYDEYQRNIETTLAEIDCYGN